MSDYLLACLTVKRDQLRERLDAQLRENDRLCALIAEMKRAERHEDAGRAVGAHLREQPKREGE